LDRQIRGQQARDRRKERHLLEHGWRVLTVWECAVTGRSAKSLATIGKYVKAWLKSSAETGSFAGDRDA
jgi:DNA mismatch endonuclease (patch repair protein)